MTHCCIFKKSELMLPSNVELLVSIFLQNVENSLATENKGIYVFIVSKSPDQRTDITGATAKKPESDRKR